MSNLRLNNIECGDGFSAALTEVPELYEYLGRHSKEIRQERRPAGV